MSFNPGDSVRFTKQFADTINPNTSMVVHPRTPTKEDCVWVEFLTLPALDNLRLVPVSMLEPLE